MREPPRVSGGEGENGHLDELSRDPIGLMARVRAECGDVGEFTLAERDVVLLTGADANEFYFRAPEEQLDQAEAYPFMTPIFGEGVVFDAPPERRREMLHNQALRDKFMRGHAATIAAGGGADGRRLGRRGRDRPAGVVRRTDDLHVVGLPHRPALPQRARQPLRPALPRPRTGNGPDRLRRPLR